MQMLVYRVILVPLWYEDGMTLCLQRSQFSESCLLPNILHSPDFWHTQQIDPTESHRCWDILLETTTPLYCSLQWGYKSTLLLQLMAPSRKNNLPRNLCDNLTKCEVHASHISDICLAGLVRKPHQRHRGLRDFFFLEKLCGKCLNLTRRASRIWKKCVHSTSNWIWVRLLW